MGTCQHIEHCPKCDPQQHTVIEKYMDNSDEIHWGDILSSKDAQDIQPPQFRADCQPRRARGCNTPLGRVHCTTWMWHGNMYVFGGNGAAQGSSASNETFMIPCEGDPAESWRRLRCSSTGSTLPPFRSKSTATILRDAVFIFGGKGANGEVLGDVWKLDLNKTEWSLVPAYPDAKPPTLGQFPSPRRSHTSVAFDNKVLIFGGMGLERTFACDVFLNCAWFLDVTTSKIPEWSRVNIIEPNGKCPEPRSCHTATVISNKMMVVIGGMSTNITGTSNGPMLELKSVGTESYAADIVWVLHENKLTLEQEKKDLEGTQVQRKLLPVSYRWSTPDVTGTSPGKLFGHSATLVTNGKQQNLVVYGGKPSKCIPTNNMYVLTVNTTTKRTHTTTNTTTWTWSTVKQSKFLEAMPPRISHITGIVRNKHFVVYGGSSVRHVKAAVYKSMYESSDVYAVRITFKTGHEAKRPSLYMDVGKTFLDQEESTLAENQLTSEVSISHLSNLNKMNDETNNIERAPTARLRRILSQRGPRSKIMALRLARGSKWSVKKLLQRSSENSTQLHENSKGLPNPKKKRRPLLVEWGSDETTMAEEKALFIRKQQEADMKRAEHQHAQHKNTRNRMKKHRNTGKKKRPSDYLRPLSSSASKKIVMAGFKGSSGLVNLGLSQGLRHPFTMKLGMYGKKPHLNHIRKKRPLSAPRRRNIHPDPNSLVDEKRRKERPRSAVGLSSSSSMFRVTDSISQASMKSSVSSTSGLSLPSSSPIRKSRPASAIGKRHCDKTKIMRSGRMKTSRPQSAKQRRHVKFAA